MQIDRHHLPSMNKVFSLITNIMEGGVDGRMEGRKGEIGRDRGRGKKRRGRRQLRVLFLVCLILSSSCQEVNTS